MTVAAASDLHKAVTALWAGSGLDDEFNQHWDAAKRAVYPVLHDGEATPHQPFPYCVFMQSAGSTEARMSCTVGVNREVRDVPWTFRVHAKSIVGDPRNAKGVAADLAELVMRVFGGHPSVAPSDLELENGNFLITQYLSDYGLRTGDDEHLWVVNYSFRVDVPVMT